MSDINGIPAVLDWASSLLHSSCKASFLAPVAEKNSNPFNDGHGVPHKMNVRKAMDHYQIESMAPTVGADCTGVQFLGSLLHSTCFSSRCKP